MNVISRRTLVGGAIAGSALATWASGQSTNETDQQTAASNSLGLATTARPWPTVDTNAHLFQWPFRRLPYDSPQDLTAKFASLDIRQAWVASFEGLLHRDVAGVNERLTTTCAEDGKSTLLPIGVINVGLPDWEDDVRRCDEQHHMRGIRLYPNYHDYTLDDARLVRLLQIAADRNLLVQICVSMEDRRTQHPRLQAADVALTPLVSAVGRAPRVQVQLLNHKLTAANVAELAACPQVSFDTTRVEGTDGIAKLVQKIGADRILMGSHAPMFILETALIKLYESNLDDRTVAAILGENAQRLIAV